MAELDVTMVVILPTGTAQRGIEDLLDSVRWVRGVMSPPRDRQRHDDRCRPTD